MITAHSLMLAAGVWLVALAAWLAICGRAK
jgi:hypothetical protein